MYFELERQMLLLLCTFVFTRSANILLPQSTIYGSSASCCNNNQNEFHYNYYSCNKSSLSTYGFFEFLSVATFEKLKLKAGKIKQVSAKELVFD